MKPNDKAIEAARKVVIQRATHNFFNPSFLFGVIEAALDAAYAAQFQSEDYAGLVKELRAECRDWLTADCVEKAADALEAVLAEREAWKGRQEATATILKQVEDERDAAIALAEQRMHGWVDEGKEKDALAARLAPVDDEALVEIGMQAGYKSEYGVDMPIERAKTSFVEYIYKPMMTAAIAAIRPHIEAAEREKLQKMLARMGAGTTKTGVVNE